MFVRFLRKLGVPLAGIICYISVISNEAFGCAAGDFSTK
jgi:hypothetical protein